MASVQKQFDEFNSKIRLGKFKEEQTLREKRDIIRIKLTENLPAVFKKYNETNLVPRFRDQGSYEMGTGVKPQDSDFDIDQGVYFETPTKDYPDPVILKERVFEALEGHTKKMEMRRPCVTVFYQNSGEDIYHVDLAIYSDRSKNTDGKDYLATGKKNSKEELRLWQESDPAGLTSEIFEQFEGDSNGRKQFRRIIRFMKRWKDINFSSNGNGAPRGIALTISTHYDFTPHYSDSVTQKPNELEALLDLVKKMLNGFKDVWCPENRKYERRLVAELPVAPYTDVYERMSEKHMADYEANLKKLKEALEFAKEEVDPTEACKKLQKVFGEDFPVPPKKETARATPPPVASSGNAA